MLKLNNVTHSSGLNTYENIWLTIHKIENRRNYLHFSYNVKQAVRKAKMTPRAIDRSCNVERNFSLYKQKSTEMSFNITRYDHLWYLKKYLNNFLNTCYIKFTTYICYFLFLFNYYSKNK